MKKNPFKYFFSTVLLMLAAWLGASGNVVMAAGSVATDSNGTGADNTGAAGTNGAGDGGASSRAGRGHGEPDGVRL